MRRIRAALAVAAVAALSACGEVKTTFPPLQQPTATSKPTAVQPRFGGQLADFIATFGQPNDHSSSLGGQYHFARYAGSNIDQIVLTVDLAGGTSFQTTVHELTIQANGAWDVAMAQAMCAAYFPVDAKAVGQQVEVVTPQGIVGKDVIYFSASLAAALPAGEFIDAKQNAATAGSFDVLYSYGALNQSTSIVACRMLPGIVQTTP
jgi:hypothetical protein